jgi:hypothetical protein
MERLQISYIGENTMQEEIRHAVLKGFATGVIFGGFAMILAYTSIIIPILRNIGF